MRFIFPPYEPWQRESFKCERRYWHWQLILYDSWGCHCNREEQSDVAGSNPECKRHPGSPRPLRVLAMMVCPAPNA